METISPIIPLIHPFSAFPFEVSWPQIRMPKIAIRKNSQEANFSANFVRIGVKLSTKMTEISVPHILAVVARKMPSPPSPLLAIGCPSSAVAAEAGVPGMLMRMALWHPPEIAPT